MPDGIEVPGWMITTAQDITPEITVGDTTIPEEFVFIFGVLVIIGLLAGAADVYNWRRKRRERGASIARDSRRQSEDD